MSSRPIWPSPFVLLLPLLAASLQTPSVSAAAITGTVKATSISGQDFKLKMTINDAVTRLEMTGPDYSWYAFGFDTTQMMGYALIVQGLDAARTVVEQNLVATGNPGSPQVTQNISLISLTHDADSDLTTVVVERLNATGDPLDPVFSPSMTGLNIIWAYSSFSTPDSPNGTLSFHGASGRGTTTIAFAPVPEPATLALAAIGAFALFRPSRSRLSGRQLPKPSARARRANPADETSIRS